jgi:hypothetical protein
MKIGIDISQIVYEGTGVAQYVRKLVEELLATDTQNEYVLFFSHYSAKITNYELQIEKTAKAKFSIKKFRFPIQFLEFLWNRLHTAPIEWFVGNVDVFYTSDWVEPPTQKARKITTIHDLSVLKYPETFDAKIVRVHRRKLQWVSKESTAILCDSKKTMEDARELLNISDNRLHVVYPGL